MSNNSKYAAYNISQGKGFECPTCNQYVSAGYDHCPHCGEMPTMSSHYSTVETPLSETSLKYNKDITGYKFWIIAVFASTLLNRKPESIRWELINYLILASLFFTIVSLRHIITIFGVKLKKIDQYKSREEIGKLSKFRRKRYIKNSKMVDRIMRKDSIFNIIVRLWVLYNSFFALNRFVKIWLLFNEQM